MHASILGAGLLVLAAQCALADCPAPQAALQEVFVAADCADCWSAPRGAAATAAAGWRLDWIVPGRTAAPLALAALPEAVERARRLRLAPPAGQQQLLHRQPAARPLDELELEVESGPAWRGYFGLRLVLLVGAGRPLPEGSSGWLALIESLPAGTEDSPVQRNLVRNVAGPLPLAAVEPGVLFSHLRALRWPDSAQPQRLHAVGWIEAADGRVIAIAADRCP